MIPMLLLLLACQPDLPAAPGSGGSRADTGDTHTEPDTHTGGDTDTCTGGDADTATPTLAEVTAIAPALGDTWGGGGRVVITVDTSVGATGASLGGVPLTDFAIDDESHLSGVPGAHEAGVVDVVVDGAVGAGLFEYWSPAQIPQVDLYLDAGKGFTGDRWLDQGPKARALVQDDPARQPTLVDGLVRFAPQRHYELPVPSELPTGSSIFAVASWTATAQVAAGSTANCPLTIVGDRTSGYGAFGASADQVESNHYVGGPVRVHGGEGLNDGVLRLIGATHDTTTTSAIYVGNVQQGPDDISAPLVGLNSWDTIGAGALGVDGWEGALGAVVIVPGVIDRGDRTKLDQWAWQRFGTPESPPLDPWTRVVQSTLPESWHPRDGAQMVQLATGRILMIGGWSPYDPWGGSRTTNEVWASDDDGLTWQLLLAHDPDPPKDGPGARFPPGHTVGVTTWEGHAVLTGSDCLSPPLEGELWHESDDGQTWTRVATDAPSAGRCLVMVGNLDEDLYMMGGQADLYDASSAIADVWRSTDGGVTWDPLDAPPWSGRGMVYRPVALDGSLYVLGGGRYDDTEPVAFNGVYAFDGMTWTTVLEDGHTHWEASYYNAVAALDGRLWMFNGYTGVEELSRALYTDDGGTTWAQYPGGSGGVESHADAALALDDRVLRVSGNLGAREVWAFAP